MSRLAFRRRTFVLSMLALLAMAFAPRARADDLEAAWAGKTVHARVALRFEANKKELRAASTNFYAYKELFPVGSEFTVTAVSSKAIELTSPKDPRPLRLDYIAKHTQIPFDELLARTFALKPVALPADLPPREKALIEGGRIEPGMARRAVFLAIGYPPASLNPSFEGPALAYQRTRFAKFVVNFDASGKVRSIDGAMTEAPPAPAPDVLAGKKLYARVNLRARFDDPDYQAPSTNYLGYSKLFPVGTAFVVLKEGAKALELRPDGSKTTFVLDYVADHTQMPLDEYVKRTFSETKVALPGNLTARERELVAAGLIEAGMSRAALFLAAGYPPGNLNPSMDADKLAYMRMPAKKTIVHLAKGKVTKIDE